MSDDDEIQRQKAAALEFFGRLADTLPDLGFRVIFRCAVCGTRAVG